MGSIFSRFARAELFSSLTDACGLSSAITIGVWNFRQPIKLIDVERHGNSASQTGYDQHITAKIHDGTRELILITIDDYAKDGGPEVI